jgi:hypothetical protein
MSFGFDFGRLRSDSTGLSFVGRVDYTGAPLSTTFDSPAYEYATAAQALLLPTVNIPAATIPVYPSVTATLNQTVGRITVSATAGNTPATILVFVR